jgi:hypothetical protein
MRALPLLVVTLLATAARADQISLGTSIGHAIIESSGSGLNELTVLLLNVTGLSSCNPCDLQGNASGPGLTTGTYDATAMEIETDNPLVEGD